MGYLAIAVFTSMVAALLWLLTGGTALMSVLVYVLTGQLVLAAYLARFYLFGYRR
ncbi:MAG: hypothetical protein P1U53_01575 [Sulfitobacter sp.]|nr:hypothetical protein [Sulfitobacter sp.]